MKFVLVVFVVVNVCGMFLGKDKKSRNNSIEKEFEESYPEIAEKYFDLRYEP